MINDWTFEQYYKKYYRSVSRFFTRQGFSALEADDLTQDVFLRVYKCRDQFRGEASFRTWVHRIASNIWKNTVRADLTNKRKGVETLYDEDHIDNSAFREEAPALEGLMYKQKSRQIRNVIEQFPRQMRCCIVLRIYQGLKYREIATTLQIPMETVKTQLHLARERLLQELSETGEPFHN